MPKIVLFGYPTSPYFNKVILVLNFLKLPFSIYPQPRQLPRPDFASLGINYRRIPLLSIDGHFHCDTSLIIDKLCEIARVPNHRETEFLGSAMFPFCAMLIPFGLITDPSFLADRTALTGRPWTAEGIKRQRPFALAQFLAHLEVVTQLLRNGGGFVREGKVTIADLHLSFVCAWVLLGHRGAEPEVSRQTHPQVFEWLEEVQKAIAVQKPAKVTFDQVKSDLLGAYSSSSSPSTSASTTTAGPTGAGAQGEAGLQVGQLVSVTPTDTGRTHPQLGIMRSCDAREVCLQTREGAVMSFPRVNYVVAPVKQQQGKEKL